MAECPEVRQRDIERSKPFACVGERLLQSLEVGDGRKGIDEGDVRHPPADLTGMLLPDRLNGGPDVFRRDHHDGSLVSEAYHGSCCSVRLAKTASGHPPPSTLNKISGVGNNPGPICVYYSTRAVDCSARVSRFP